MRNSTDSNIPTRKEQSLGGTTCLTNFEILKESNNHFTSLTPTINMLIQRFTPPLLLSKLESKYSHAIARIKYARIGKKSPFNIAAVRANYSTTPGHYSNNNGNNNKEDSYQKLFRTQRAEMLTRASDCRTMMKYNSKQYSQAETVFNDGDAENLIRFATEEEIQTIQNNQQKSNTVQQLLDLSVYKPYLIDFKGKSGSTEIIYIPSANNTVTKRILVVGLGKTAELNENSFRSAVYTAISTMKNKQLKSAAIIVPKLEKVSFLNSIDILTRISTLSNHQFSKYVTKKASNFVENLTLFTAESSQEEIENTIRRAQTISECTILARELTSDRGDVIHPESMEQFARAVAETHTNLSFNCLQEKELKELGLSLIVAVGQAAQHKARIITLEYKGKTTENTVDVAIVGKGITFDTGGLNLKPTNSIETMYMDMAGSAAVLATIKAIAILKPNINVVAVLALAENSIDSLSIKPHSIIHSAKGTVQISNTDAEGRLALADAFTHVQNNFKPKQIIDMATLTGACVVALGEYTAGLFSNNELLAKQLEESGNKVRERVWRLPIEPEIVDELKCNYADIKSTGSGKGGGACSAAAFLQKFVDEKDGVEWAHIDVAGPAMYSKQREWMPEGGTGFGVQLLTEYILNKANNS